MCRITASRLSAIGSGCFLDPNEQIEQIFDKWLSLWARLNEMGNRKSHYSGLRAARVGGWNVCSKAKIGAATCGASVVMLDEQLAESVAYLGLDLVVLLLLLLLLILLLLLLLLLISLVAITNHLLELPHNIGRDLLK